MVSRRKLLTSSLGFAGSVGLATSLQMGFVRQASAMAFGDYKAMICILLAGGNDSFNMIVPADDDQYTEYQTIRSDLALPRADLRVLSGTSNGRTYGLHPSLFNVRDMYDAGEVAVLANVGPLVDRVTAADVANGAPVPLGLASHADQIQTWQTARADLRVADGWGGRLADAFQGTNPANGISMNISLSGSNVFQSGLSVVPYSIDVTEEGAPGVQGYNDTSVFDEIRTRRLDELLALNQPNLLRAEYSRRLREAIDTQAVFAEALSLGDTFNTSFAQDGLGQALRQIVRVIAARNALGAVRQTFFVNLGGWDHHDDVLDNQGRLLPIVNNGLKSLRDALVELGVFDSVTTFTTSDFGRTLTSNGKGSDHGWGGHHFVMGGSVQGGQFFGDYPELQAAHPLDIGRGVFAPTTSVDEYFAELALWFGLPASSLGDVLPNIGTFYTPGSATPPLGFLS